MQGTTDDRNDMAYCSMSLGRACVTDFREGCSLIGTHDAAERVVPGEAVQRFGAAEGRVPRQGCEQVGDHATGIRNGETATRGGLQAALCGNRN